MHSQIISRILVPIDGSENAYRAAHFAIGIAKKYGAELVVVHALDLNRSLAYLGVYGIPYTESIKEMVNAARSEATPWFAQIKKEADSLGVKMKTDIIEAPLSLVGEIINYAENNQVDLIVAGSKGRTGIRKLLLGSIASGIVTYAHCPVLITK